MYITIIKINLVIDKLLLSLFNKQNEIDMKTSELSEVIKALKAAGMDYELTGLHTFGMWIGNTFFENGTTYAIDLGIKLSRGIWAWYTVRGLENGCADEFWFRQRYNCNCGKVLKSFRTERKITDQLEKQLGVKLRPY